MGKLPRYAVIMAGGQGTRFWPRSRERMPKQLLAIAGRRTMLEETLDRIAPLCRPSRTLIVAGRDHAALVRKRARRLPRRNVLVEPIGRNTAPCIALAAQVIRKRDGDGIMLVLPADHVVADTARFGAVLKRAIELAEDGWLVTLGVRPSYPETGYGYVEAGKALAGPPSPRARQVRRFHEKPSIEAARRYVRGGRHLWNSGMFVWRASVIGREIERQLPGIAQALGPLEARSVPKAGALARAYARMQSISIDKGVMEAAERVAVVEGDFGWSDVGSWEAMPGLWGIDGDGNATRGSVIAIDTANSIAFAGKRLVALLGVEDLVVVDSDDALLVCRRGRAQDVRRVVDELRRRRLGRYL